MNVTSADWRPGLRVLACALVLAVAHAGSALASLPGAPSAPVAAAIANARLAGEGSLRWMGLKIYDIRLWVGADGIAADRFASSPLALEVRYARAIPAETIARTSVAEIERLGFGDPQRRQAWARSLQGVLPDVRAGDRLTGVNHPGRGVTFYQNDRRIGAIDDPQFAAAFFSIWLDPRTTVPDLRERLTARLGADSGGDL